MGLQTLISVGVFPVSCEPIMDISLDNPGFNVDITDAEGFSEVGVMSQSDCCRRLSVAPLAGVERQWRGSLGSGSLAVDISSSLPSGSRFIQGTHPFAGVLSQLDQGQSSGGRGPVLAGQRSGRSRSSSLSRLLQPVVCSSESLRSVEAGHRPLTFESEGAADILQDGDSPVCTSVSACW